MPLYEYECKHCGSQFEQLVFNRESKIVCKFCGGQNVMRRLSTFAISTAGARPTSGVEPGPCGACGAPQRGMCAVES